MKKRKNFPYKLPVVVDEPTPTKPAVPEIDHITEDMVTPVRLKRVCDVDTSYMVELLDDLHDDIAETIRSVFPMEALEKGHGGNVVLNDGTIGINTHKAEAVTIPGFIIGMDARGNMSRATTMLMETNQGFRHVAYDEKGVMRDIGPLDNIALVGVHQPESLIVPLNNIQAVMDGASFLGKMSNKFCKAMENLSFNPPMFPPDTGYEIEYSWSDRKFMEEEPDMFKSIEREKAGKEMLPDIEIKEF